MELQCPIESEAAKLVVKDLEFYDGRKLCTEDRLIRNTLGYPQIHKHDPVIIRRMTQILAWYRDTPVTAMVKHENNFVEIIVAEPDDMVDIPTVNFMRYLPFNRRAFASIVTNDLTRVHSRIIDLQMQAGEFSVSLMVDDSNQPFHTQYYSNAQSWKLMGPNRTKTQVEHDLLKNFNEVMETISREVNGAKGSNYDREEEVYVFWIWDATLYDANVDRVRRAITSTGWTVVVLVNDVDGIKLVIK